MLLDGDPNLRQTTRFVLGGAILHSLRPKIPSPWSQSEFRAVCKGVIAKEAAAYVAD